MSGAVAFADFSQQVIVAANDLAAERRTAMAREGRHQRSAKGSVVHRQFLARRDIATGDEVQTVEPCVRIAGVIDRSPHVWIVAPEDVEIVGQRPRVLLEPLLSETRPVPLDLPARNQNVRARLVTLDDAAGADRADRTHYKAAISLESQFPRFRCPVAAPDGASQQVFEKQPVS